MKREALTEIRGGLDQFSGFITSCPKFLLAEAPPLQWGQLEKCQISGEVLENQPNTPRSQRELIEASEPLQLERAWKAAGRFADLDSVILGSGVPEVDEFPIHFCSSNTEHRAWYGMTSMWLVQIKGQLHSITLEAFYDQAPAFFDSDFHEYISSSNQILGDGTTPSALGTVTLSQVDTWLPHNLFHLDQRGVSKRLPTNPETEMVQEILDLCDTLGIAPLGRG
ncbi:hypothetical protein MJG53_012976 [Ovis ammon polii x Ovis aries]|uniref:Uncharacterized protein n=1 Tax=Ovis ammon polii x Ovis aries TaxID=2918886 RepID=A0ACB9UMF2_9CETA|nr:hypothetical protein MJG53_012976 [Ovis ammon polii x Ovis aries]